MKDFGITSIKETLIQKQYCIPGRKIELSDTIKDLNISSGTRKHRNFFFIKLEYKTSSWPHWAPAVLELTG